MAPGLGTVLSVLLACILALGSVLAAGYREPYLPIGTVSDFEQNWYASHLFAMGEPALGTEPRPAGYTALRLLYLPTWGRPIALRYESDGVSANRRAVKLSGSGGYDPGKIAFERSLALSEPEMREVLRAFDATGYWQMSKDDGVHGLDGSRLIVETVRDGEHRVRVRWSPDYGAKERGLDPLVSFYMAQFEDAGLWGPDMH